ncbi:MAG TPA: ATP-binding cassette domain-containing protein [Candidatus Cloacimonadota bacterium]|nr:ATP-binding cassette domain-containing protein [Candidatus Cloacimonadota bacterium]HQH50036.1 ATP-binding cassette domain-containing protein [Candidatus Cloacimonadota bacterium]
MSVILRAEGLSKSFLLNGEPRLIILGLDLSVREGIFLSIVGSSGCGKSTLLGLLAGITRPDKGRIILRGEDITGKSGMLGYMPQEDLLFPWLNVLENALIPVRVRNGDIRAALVKLHQLLPVFGLQDHAQHLPYQLSGGLRQRTALLRTCMMETPLLLLDEPFANLDAITRLQLQEWLCQITRELKLTVMLVTHDIDEAISLSDEIHLMQGQPGNFVKRFELDDTTKADEKLRAGLKKEIIDKVKGTL